VKLRSVPPAGARETRPDKRLGPPMPSAVDTLGAPPGGAFVRSPSAELEGFASAELDLPPTPASRKEATPPPPTAAPSSVREVEDATAPPLATLSREMGAPVMAEQAYAPEGSWLRDSIPPAIAPELDVVPVRRPVRVEPTSTSGRGARRGEPMAPGALVDVVLVVVGCLLCALAAVAVLVGVRHGHSAFLGRADSTGLFRDGLALFFLGVAVWLVSGAARRAKVVTTAAFVLVWCALAYGLAFGIDRAVARLLVPS